MRQSVSITSSGDIQMVNGRSFYVSIKCILQAQTTTKSIRNYYITAAL